MTSHWCCSRVGLCLSGNKQSTVVNSWIRRTSQHSSARGAFAGPLRQQGEVWAGMICDCAHALRSGGFTLWVWEVSSWVYFPSLYRTPCMFPAHVRRGFGCEIMQAMSTYVFKAFCLSHENPARAKERLRLNVWFSIFSAQQAKHWSVPPGSRPREIPQQTVETLVSRGHGACSVQFSHRTGWVCVLCPAAWPSLTTYSVTLPRELSLPWDCRSALPLEPAQLLKTWMWPEFTQRLLIRTSHIFLFSESVVINDPVLYFVNPPQSCGSILPGCISQSDFMWKATSRPTGVFFTTHPAAPGMTQPCPVNHQRPPPCIVQHSVGCRGVPGGGAPFLSRGTHPLSQSSFSPAL